MKPLDLPDWAYTAMYWCFIGFALGFSYMGCL